MIKVLAVDNDADILTVVKLILSANGFRVDAIRDWKLIDNKIDIFKPDIILLDVSLGGEDGRNICRKIKDNPQHKHMPVVLFSAKISETDLQDSKANGFIAKPFDANNLAAKLKFYLTSINGN